MIDLFRTLPAWMVTASGLALVALLGWIDFLTGDYSILVFYLLPVAFCTWFGGRSPGIAVTAVAGIARFCSEIYAASPTPLAYWNGSEDTLFLFIASFLIYRLKKRLEQEENGK